MVTNLKPVITSRKPKYLNTDYQLIIHLTSYKKCFISKKIPLAY